MTFLFTALVCIFGVSATSGEVSLGDDWYPMGEEGDATAASGRILSNGTNSTPTTPTPAPAPLAVGGVACYENWQCGYFQAGWDLLLVSGLTYKSDAADDHYFLSNDLIPRILCLDWFIMYRLVTRVKTSQVKIFRKSTGNARMAPVSVRLDSLAATVLLPKANKSLAAAN
jgi:hypothetical protein